jgi:hypothetical protein
MTEPHGFVVPTGRMVNNLFKKKKKYKTKNPTRVVQHPVLTEQKAKTLIAMLETKFAQLKKDQTTIALPSDLIESTARQDGHLVKFPNVNADYKTRLETCTFLRSYLADIRREDLQNKVRACVNSIPRRISN